MANSVRAVPLALFSPATRTTFFLSTALVLAATVLVLVPLPLPDAVAYPIGIGLVWFLPGYFVEGILLPFQWEISVVRLPQWFVFSLFVLALPATALQFIGGNWYQFHLIHIALLWSLWLVSSWRRARVPVSARSKMPRSEYVAEGILLAVCAVVALYVARGARDADDWLYLQITQQILGSNPFQLRQASETRYTLRYAFHVWLFTQAYLGQWLRLDLVTLAREVLPSLVSMLGLVSFYAWARVFFRTPMRALVAVLIQVGIAVTFITGSGWGSGLLARSAQDKFLVWLVVVPPAMLFAWRFLTLGRRSFLVAYAAALLAGLWVHPVAIFLVPLSLAGFALFSLISRVPFSRARWLWLTIASLPALGAPIVIRLTTLPAVFTTQGPLIQAYVRLSDGRLFLFGDWYIVDPAMVSHPLILFSFFLLVAFAARLWRDTRIQFLWGSALVPLALLFNPLTARILGELFTPWQLWRMTWNVPSAFILTEAVFQVREGLRAATFRLRTIQIALVVLAVVASIGLYDVNPVRWWNILTKDHTLEAPTEDMLRHLKVTLTQPSNVLLPREITRYAPAYTYLAQVMSNDAQKPEDAAGQQIDRFYDPKALPQLLNGFLTAFQIEYAIVETHSPQDEFLQSSPRAQFLYHNTVLSLYKIAPQ